MVAGRSTIRVGWQEIEAHKIETGDLVWTQDYLLIPVQIDRMVDPGTTVIVCAKTGSKYRIPNWHKVWAIRRNGAMDALWEAMTGD